MKHKREEIIRFVEKRISGDKKFRRLTPLMGLAFIGCSFAFFKMVIENEHTATLPFLMGFVFAVLFLPTASIGIALVFGLFRIGSFESDAYHLLLELWKKKQGNAEPSDTPNPHSPSAQGFGGR